MIVIAGPTAVGKTRLSLSLARLIQGEIISADSMQVYRGMDIGTAKASHEERDEIPHHLIDIVDIDQPFNVVQYFHEARKALKEILEAGNVPIVVGGSGFYLHVFLYGPPQGPPPNPEVRRQLEKQMNQLGADVMYERLQMVDPIYANSITPNDKQKIIRGLEIIALSDKKVSDFPATPKEPIGDYQFHCWFLHYPKNILYPMIEQRCDEMLQQGFLAEVEKLKNEGLERNPTASQAIGYKQALAYLKSSKKPTDWEDFVISFKKATRNYAKRQFTWFRKESHFRWIDLEKVDIEMAKEYILHDFEQSL